MFLYSGHVGYLLPEVAVSARTSGWSGPVWREKVARRLVPACTPTVSFAASPASTCGARYARLGSAPARTNPPTYGHDAGHKYHRHHVGCHKKFTITSQTLQICANVVCWITTFCVKFVTRLFGVSVSCTNLSLAPKPAKMRSLHLRSEAVCPLPTPRPRGRLSAGRADDLPHERGAARVQGSHEHREGGAARAQARPAALLGAARDRAALRVLNGVPVRVFSISHSSSSLSRALRDQRRIVHLSPQKP